MHNPSLRHPDHENCLLQTTIIKKSSRKAFINGVRTFQNNGTEIEVAWSDRIDPHGDPQDGGAQIMTVINASSLCIRCNDSKAFSDVRVEVMHSFDTKPMILIFDFLAAWQGYFAE